MTNLTNYLKVHQLIPQSRSNGPGVRFTIWVQGCDLGCKGCFNPETHALNAGFLASGSQLLGRILSEQPHIDGITISGGEPFQQAEPLAALLHALRNRTPLSTIIFTGYTINELHRIPFADDVVSMCDVIIAGRYNQRKRLAKGLLGSSNKQIHLMTNRFTRSDFVSIPETEIIIDSDGEIEITGIDPLVWRK